jgi:hypothetical protein
MSEHLYKKIIMTTMVIKPKNKAEEALLTQMLRKMNVEAHLVHEPLPNYDTRSAIQDTASSKGTKAKNAEDLFRKLGI